MGHGLWRMVHGLGDGPWISGYESEGWMIKDMLWPIGMGHRDGPWALGLRPWATDMGHGLWV